jgi:hypothetical protein
VTVLTIFKQILSLPEERVVMFLRDSDYSRIYEFKVQVVDNGDNFIETTHQITVRPPTPPAFNPPAEEFALDITIECSDPSPRPVLAVWDFVVRGSGSI